ncbi:MAG: hypothetical protein NT166_28625 [Candidatus Aminicenantes bacterium]|nr:hypothetical protein [Candidatus Aminicenantes bacterium]
MNKINIFVASGNEFIEERKQIIHVLDKLEEIFPHLHLKAKEWEIALPSGSYEGKTIQDEIDPLLEKSAVVLVLFHSKLGKFTVHEYQLACKNNKKVFLYFKTGFSPKNNKELRLYRKVLFFKMKVEKENKVNFKEYDSLERFETLLKDDLALYLAQEYGRKEDSEEKIPAESVHRMILRGSRAYYEGLRGENGRFRMLHIEDLILSRPDTKEKWVPQPVSSDGDDAEYGQEETVITLLTRWWQGPCQHAIIVGDGGMGKTVSLVRLWETLLIKNFLEVQGAIFQLKPLAAEGNNDGLVPVFIALNEFNQVKEEKRQGFILNYIRENYCDSPTTVEEIWDALKLPVQEGVFKPRFVLLLDGFNEIIVGKKELLLEIKRIMEQCPGVRMVLTSRFDMRGQYQWGNWDLVRLMKLEKEQVESYLQEKKLGLPGQERFLQLIRNPMMLTLLRPPARFKTRTANPLIAVLKSGWRAWASCCGISWKRK